MDPVLASGLKHRGIKPTAQDEKFHYIAVSTAPSLSTPSSTTTTTIPVSFGTSRKGISFFSILKKFGKFILYLPLLVFVAGLVGIVVMQAQTCSNSHCQYTCINSSLRDWQECLEECRCFFIPPPFWLQPWKAVKTISEGEDTLAMCPNGYAPIPTLQRLPDVPPKKKSPNFVLIFMDDLDELVSPYFESMPFARTLFEKNGTKYANAFSSTSLCCPARCQILTGMQGHNTGVLYNTGDFGGRHGFVHPLFENGTRMKDDQGRCYNNEYRTAAALLKENANYASGVFGKYVAGIEYGEMKTLPPGWTDFHVGADHKIYTGYQYSLMNWTEGMEYVEMEWRNDYVTDVLRDKALYFIDKYRQQKEEKPMFVYMAGTAPHFPITPAHRHRHMEGYWAARYDELVASRPTFYNETEIFASKSRWLKDNLAPRFNLKTYPFTRLDFIKRMTSLMAVDEMIEAVYRKIESYGEIDNTIFVMTSDNGYNYGSHGLAHKLAPYEESVRVPLYISGPGFPKGAVTTDMAELLDILPTFLESAGFEVPSYMDGFSLIPKKSDNNKNAKVSTNNNNKNDNDNNTKMMKRALNNNNLPNSNNFVELKHKRSAVLIEYKGLHSYYGNVTMEMEIDPRFRARDPPAGMVGMDIPPYRAIRTEDYLFVDYYYFIANEAFNGNNKTHNHIPFEEEQLNGKNKFKLLEDDVKKGITVEHEYEIYDMRNDPYQTRNLVKEIGENSDLFKKLQSKLEIIRHCKGKDCYIN